MTAPLLLTNLLNTALDAVVVRVVVVVGKAP